MKNLFAYIFKPYSPVKIEEKHDFHQNLTKSSSF